MRLTIETSKGNILIQLYDETPQHRDNFIKLVEQHYYDGTLFHRVIKDFMIQAGDPDSKGAPKGKMLGTGGPDYKVPAEIVYPTLFHKRGSLCAARQSDEVNPERESSGSQFYIVWGKVYKPNELKQMEKQLAMQQKQQVFNALAFERRSDIISLRRNRDHAGLQALQDELEKQAIERCNEIGKPQFTAKQTEAYTTLGGTPHLDGQYTVFGCVTKGLDVVEEIIKSPTDRNDRPLENIEIKSICLE